MTAPPLRVLHVSTGLHTGGAETMLFRLVAEADRTAFRHAVVCLRRPGPVGRRLHESGVEVHSLDMRGLTPWPHHVIRLWAIARRFAPDVVHGWMVHGNMAATAVAFGGSVPLVWGIRQSLYDLAWERGTTRALIRAAARLSRRPARIVYNSRSGARHHEALGYDAARTVVIPNGFDTVRFHPSPAHRAAIRRELEIPESAVLVGMVARFHPLKGHANLLAAAELLVRAGEGVDFLLVGRGIDDAAGPVAAIRREAGLEDRIRLLGERADMERIYAALDVAVLASYSEGFPNVVGEAMACGVPCVVTDVGEAPAIVGETGRVVPPGDPAAMARGIAWMVEGGPERRLALGAAARERIEREFALPTVRRRYEDLYREVAAAAAARRNRSAEGR